VLVLLACRSTNGNSASIGTIGNRSDAANAADNTTSGTLTGYGSGIFAICNTIIIGCNPTYYAARTIG